jgi:tetratricopeptide (TPR) repeat protein
MVEEALSFWTDIQRYEDMLAADPQSLSFAPLSELYRKLGLLDDALSVAQKGCALHPEYAAGLFALAAACHAKGLKVEARSALERVVQIAPDHAAAQKLLGQLYVEAGDNEKAQRALGQVLQQNPEDAEVALLLRSIATAPAPATEAVTSDEEYLEEAEVIEDLTELFDEPESGAAEILEASEVPEVSKVPEVPEVLEVLEVLNDWSIEEVDEFDDLDEVDEAREVMAPAAPAAREEDFQHPSRDPLTTATLAELYVSQGFLDKAIAIYQELLAADPGNHSYLFRRNELLAVRERQKEVQCSPAPVPPLAAAVPVAASADAASAAASAGAVAADQTGAADAELYRWLENIRRRRDGL